MHDYYYQPRRRGLGNWIVIALLAALVVIAFGAVYPGALDSIIGSAGTTIDRLPAGGASNRAPLAQPTLTIRQRVDTLYGNNPPVATAEPQTEPVALPTAPPEYQQTISEQAPHAPRSVPTAEPAPPAPIEPSQVDPNARAADVPPISQEQAQIITARQSNGCAPGQVFMPRSGCHTPGSGGAMPGPVGQP